MYNRDFRIKSLYPKAVLFYFILFNTYIDWVYKKHRMIWEFIKLCVTIKRI